MCSGQGGFAYLEPVATPFAGLVSALCAVQHLDHKTLTGSLDTLVQELLDLLELLAIHRCGERELALHRCKGLDHQITTMTERLLNQSLAVEVEQIKRKHAHLDLDVINLDVLLLPRHQLLERKNLLLHNVPSNSFAVENEALGVGLDPSMELGENVGILLGQIF